MFYSLYSKNVYKENFIIFLSYPPRCTTRGGILFLLLRNAWRNRDTVSRQRKESVFVNRFPSFKLMAMICQLFCIRCCCSINRLFISLILWISCMVLSDRCVASSLRLWGRAGKGFRPGGSSPFCLASSSSSAV